MEISENAAERFWAKVDTRSSDECWNWTAYIKPDTGYGQFRLGGRLSKRLPAHVVAYILVKGNVPAGKVVMHTCDNTVCCNPSHLKVGTQKENVDDMLAKGRGRWQRAALNTATS